MALFAEKATGQKETGMNYEVKHGHHTHFTKAGNTYQACLGVLREEANNDIHHAPFEVTNMGTGATETIPMEIVLRLQLIAINPDMETLCDMKGGPRIDLTHW